MMSKKDYSLLTVLFMVEFSRGAFFLSFLPTYTTTFLGWSIATAGLAASVHYFTETIFKSFAGWQFDRFGKPVILAGLFIGLVSLATAKAYSHPVQLIISSGLFGLGVSPLWIGVITGVAPVNQVNRSSRISLVFTSWLLGMGSGLVLINFFISKSYDLAYTVIIAVLLAALIIGWLFIPLNPVQRPNNGVAPGSMLLSLKYLALNQDVIRVLLPGMFLQTLSVSLLLPVLPVLATTRLGLSHDGYGMLIMAGGAATILFIIPMGRLADKINLRIILFTGFASTSAALAALALLGNKENAFAIVLILGISYAAVLPAWNTLLARAVPPENQATGWGFFSSIEGLGISSGPAIGGLLAKGFSPASVLLASGGIILIMAFFYLIYPVDRLLKNR